MNAAILCLFAVVLGAELMTQVWPGARLVGSAQSQDVGAAKTVLTDANHHEVYAPIRVIKVTENGQPIIPGWAGNPEVVRQYFTAGEDWISNLSFVVKNRSASTIEYLSVGIVFPEDQHYDQDLRFGQIPALAAPVYFNRMRQHVPKGTGFPLNFRPGQEMTISLAGYVDAIKLAKNTARPFSSLRKCAVLLISAYFTDQGLKWENHVGYMLPDSSSPEGYKRLPGEYFPGDLSQAEASD
ncbi:MAG: hypothetical protein ABSA59_06245 [Terriglobia bacterium]